MTLSARNMIDNAKVDRMITWTKKILDSWGGNRLCRVNSVNRETVVKKVRSFFEHFCGQLVIGTS